MTEKNEEGGNWVCSFLPHHLSFHLCLDHPPHRSFSAESLLVTLRLLPFPPSMLQGQTWSALPPAWGGGTGRGLQEDPPLLPPLTTLTTMAH